MPLIGKGKRTERTYLLELAKNSTYEEIGKTYFEPPVSKQRVRQLMHRNGIFRSRREFLTLKKKVESLLNVEGLSVHQVQVKLKIYEYVVDALTGGRELPILPRHSVYENKIRAYYTQSPNATFEDASRDLRIPFSTVRNIVNRIGVKTRSAPKRPDFVVQAARTFFTWQIKFREIAEFLAASGYPISESRLHVWRVRAGLPEYRIHGLDKSYVPLCIRLEALDQKSAEDAGIAWGLIRKWRKRPKRRAKIGGA